MTSIMEQLPVLQAQVEAVVRQVGRDARGRLGQVPVQIKTGDQLVTAVDRESQRRLVAALAEATPAAGVLAEEDPRAALLKQHPKDRVDAWWVIDPIDGTRNFAHGVGLFAVSVGLLVEGIPVLGVIYDPVGDVMYAAHQGGGARANGRPMRCSTATVDRNTQFGMPGQHLEGVPPAVVALMEQYVCMSLGSAAHHLAYVASGAYAGLASWNVRLWDIAAGVVLITEAGGSVTDLQGKPRFPFDCAAYQGEPVPMIGGGAPGYAVLRAALVEADAR